MSKPQVWLRRLKETIRRKGLVIAGCTAISLALIAASVEIIHYRQAAAAMAYVQPEVKPDVKRWGFSLNEFTLNEKTLSNGDVLGEILMKEGLVYPQVAKLVEACKGKFNINSMRAGRKLNFLSKGGAVPQYMVYEPSPYEYAVFNLQEPFSVEVVKRDVKTEVVAASGVLETNFWQALTDNGLNDELADGMIDVLASNVDFYHQKQGDRFKVVYEQNYVEGKAVGTGKIIAAMYERDGKEFYAFNYDNGKEKVHYYDFDGRPSRKAFLKSPVKFSRISSRYNLHRLHPILGYHKAHLGTDYAAPYGTPIMAVADGVVEEASHRGGNGNFVKLRHDKIYETQYLHMQGFAKGIRPGAHVAQGQTIGYVGATGLATGPHCCFRFWKGGKEVDHLRLNLPQPNPITGEDFQQFTMVRDSLVKLIYGVQYHLHKDSDTSEETADDGFDELDAVLWPAVKAAP
jgi:murein DD-endopeptidase MepM/ murein hydrolase activator NlpD